MKGRKNEKIIKGKGEYIDLFSVVIV